MYTEIDPWKWKAATTESWKKKFKGWTTNGKETEAGGWKDGSPGVLVVEYLVKKTMVCDYLVALGEVGK